MYILGHIIGHAHYRTTCSLHVACIRLNWFRWCSIGCNMLCLCLQCCAPVLYDVVVRAILRGERVMQDNSTPDWVSFRCVSHGVLAVVERKPLPRWQVSVGRICPYLPSGGGLGAVLPQGRGGPPLWTWIRLPATRFCVLNRRANK